MIQNFLIVLLSSLLLSCTEKEPIETLNLEVLRDDFDKSQFQINLDHMKLVRYNIFINKEVLPDNILSVKYTEKGRWRKILEIFEKYGISEKSEIINFRKLYDENSTGITSDGVMYYELDECPLLPKYYFCEDKRISYYIF